MVLRRTLASATRGRRAMSSAVGFVGLGRMGSAMAKNFADTNVPIVAYDLDPSNGEKLKAAVGDNANIVDSPEAVASEVDTVVTMLPNDKVLTAVAGEGSAFLDALKPGAVHVSCSTVSPHTSRALAASYADRGVLFAGAPVFARPDGIEKKQAYWVMGGPEAATTRAVEVLSSTSPACYVLGEDAGAGNVLKLCGNFLIACTIESLAESLALAEANGLDRVAAKDMLTETIFDCIIYKGYGQRVSERDHQAGGFALELGAKDVNLVLDTAAQAEVPMPFGSVLRDRFLAAKARGRADLDWSAIGLNSSEDSGVDVAAAVQASRDASKEA